MPPNIYISTHCIQLHKGDFERAVTILMEAERYTSGIDDFSAAIAKKKREELVLDRLDSSERASWWLSEIVSPSYWAVLAMALFRVHPEQPEVILCIYLFV